MKIELATSLELKKDISADDADKLYSEGKITSKHLFECPESNCHAQVTCANLDRPKSLRKRIPHFKFVTEHSKECKIGLNEENESRGIRKDNEDPEALPFISNDLVDFDVSSPTKTKIKEDLSSDENNNTTKRIASKNNDENNINKQRHSKKRLSGLVNSFINKENFFLNLPEGKLHIRDFFIHVNDQKDINEYLDEPRIYFGKAWLRRKDDYYIVRFDKEMRSGKLKCKPTFFISNRMVEQSEYKRTSREELDKIALAKPIKPLYLFIFSELPPVKINSGDYINFKLDNLAYLYYKPWGKHNA
ncbi:hypothetical protein [Proteus myxofaciens]|uniref:Uncharacterized protein n=1 Tax=Proteus myxofaciens ATCC 19692 TaxID=1354337 RepID=A0A198FNS9_9GAMM|nr:hypothetical protein [Proteus myxofaciens]OAT26124.1 hypothetical protein M983_2178 [Proteus myxofaciens ATCC 19692]